MVLCFNITTPKHSWCSSRPNNDDDSWAYGGWGITPLIPLTPVREAIGGWFSTLTSAAGDGLTSIMENDTFGPRAHYLRLLRRRRRYEPQYHFVLRLCSEFRDSRSFLCLNIKKSIHGKSPCINKMRRDQAGTSLSRVYTRISRLWRHKPVGKARRSMRRRCNHVKRVCLRQCAKGS